MGNHEIGQRMAAKGILVILFQGDFALRNPEHGIGQRWRPRVFWERNSFYASLLVKHGLSLTWDFSELDYLNEHITGRIFSVPVLLLKDSFTPTEYPVPQGYLLWNF